MIISTHFHQCKPFSKFNCLSMQHLHYRAKSKLIWKLRLTKLTFHLHVQMATETKELKPQDSPTIAANSLQTGQQKIFCNRVFQNLNLQMIRAQIRNRKLQTLSVLHSRLHQMEIQKEKTQPQGSITQGINLQRTGLLKISCNPEQKIDSRPSQETRVWISLQVRRSLILSPALIRKVQTMGQANPKWPKILIFTTFLLSNKKLARSLARLLMSQSCLSMKLISRCENSILASDKQQTRKQLTSKFCRVKCRGNLEACAKLQKLYFLTPKQRVLSVLQLMQGLDWKSI